MQTAAIILAAGSSTRLGHPKQLALLEGQPLLERAIATAINAGLAPILVILGANAAEIRRSVDLEGVVVIENEQWQEGMASSVRAGVGALSGATQGVVLMTCDQPAVTAQHLQTLIEQGTQAGEAIGSAYQEKHGVPAYFPHTLFPQLLLLKGDAGAKSLLTTARSLSLKNGDIDVDTPEALVRAQELFDRR